MQIWRFWKWLWIHDCVERLLNVNLIFNKIANCNLPNKLQLNLVIAISVSAKSWQWRQLLKGRVGISIKPMYFITLITTHNSVKTTVIQSLKCHFHKLIQLQMIECIDNKEVYSVNLLDAVRFDHKAWAWMKVTGYETAISDICPWQQRTKWIALWVAIIWIMWYNLDIIVSILIVDTLSVWPWLQLRRPL